MTSLNPAAIIGGGPKKRDRLGLYSTPPDCVQALLTAIDWRSDTIMEPCGGKGAIIDALRLTHRVGYSCDIDPQADGIEKRDFLTLDSSMGCTAIITNPPFALFEQFVRHAFSLGITRQAYLLKVNTFSAAKRTSLFYEHKPFARLDLTWRPDFLGLKSPTMDCTWIVFDGVCAPVCEYNLLERPE